MCLPDSFRSSQATSSNVISLRFVVKQLIIYLIEIYSGRYLNRFDHITLYFDNSI